MDGDPWQVRDRRILWVNGMAIFGNVVQHSAVYQPTRRAPSNSVCHLPSFNGLKNTAWAVRICPIRTAFPPWAFPLLRHMSSSRDTNVLWPPKLLKGSRAREPPFPCPLPSPIPERHQQQPDQGENQAQSSKPGRKARPKGRLTGYGPALGQDDRIRRTRDSCVNHGDVPFRRGCGCPDLAARSPSARVYGRRGIRNWLERRRSLCLLPHLERNHRRGRGRGSGQLHQDRRGGRRFRGLGTLHNNPYLDRIRAPSSVLGPQPQGKGLPAGRERLRSPDLP